jgi:16S rRNA (uracil1498-N3)-methyltransferase
VKRFFVCVPLGRDMKLTGTEHSHLAVVLRTRVGEKIIVCNGDEFDYVYAAEKISKHDTDLKFIEKSPNQSNPKTNLTVFLALIKPDCLSLAVQKLNEIGVAELVLFSCEFCTQSHKSVNINKLNLIAMQSCKQCGRSIPMRVRFSPDIFAELGKFDTIYLADESLRGGVSAIKAHENSAAVIGPEGGFSAKEHEIWRSMSNMIHYTLGSRILRAETAAIAISTLILHAAGEL